MGKLGLGTKVRKVFGFFAMHDKKLEKEDVVTLPDWDHASLDAVPFSGYDAVLDEVGSDSADAVPDQAVILSDLAPFLKRHIGHEDLSIDVSPSRKGEIRECVQSLMGRLDAEAVFDSANKKMGFDHKVGILLKYFDVKPPFQKVYVRRVDLKRKRLRLQAFGEMPRVLFNGDEVEPASKKSSVRNFLGDPFLCTQELSVAYTDEGDVLSFGFEGDVPVTIDVRGKGFANGVTVREVVSEFTKDWDKYPQVGNTWIIMDRDVCADDNGEHFYRYMMREHPEQRCLFALRKTSADWDRLEAEGFKLLDFGTPEFEDELRVCSTIISSHIDRYISSYFGDAYCYSKTIVFLQHGVTKDDISAWLNSKTEMDLIVTETLAEYNSIAGEDTPYRFLPDEVVLSGMPRHDALFLTAQKKKDTSMANGKAVPKTILIMPTWRNYLVGEVNGPGNTRCLNPDFHDSEYAKKWESFIGSSYIKRLSKDGFRVIFYPHANIAQYVDAGMFAIPDYVEHRSNYEELSIQQLFIDADAFVTDYSSTAFEVAYLGKPCFYYQFDAVDGRPEGYHFAKGYFDYEKDGFGPIARTQDGLESFLSQCIADGFRPQQDYSERMDETFLLKDGRNCSRVYEVIAERVLLDE